MAQVVTAAAVIWMTGCMPRDMRAVCEPRDGEAIGGRVAVVYSQRYQIDLGGFERLHPFDIRKYERIYRGLVRDGSVSPRQVFVPAEISHEDLLLVHTPEYLAHLQQPGRLAEYLEAPIVAWCLPGVADAGILRPFRYATGGTLLAARQALRCGMAINIGGGYHHAEPDRGGGFCIYADMPIAIRRLQAEQSVRRLLVIDVDAHQGNGTALCVAAEPDVYTFDMYEADIYPQPKQKNDLDVPLPGGLDDRAYLDILSRHIARVFDAARPELVILQAGVDTLAGDPLANLRLTKNGIVERDAMIFAEAARRRVPIVMTLGGGYSRNAWHAQYMSIRSLLAAYGRSHP